LPEPDETLPAAPAAAGAEPRQFAPEELLTCDSCLRANAPTRTQCLYCGAGLGAISSRSRSELPFAGTGPEANRIYIVARTGPGQAIAHSVLEQLAERLQFKPAELQAGFASCGPLPLTNASREEAAELLSELQAGGFDAFSIPVSEVETSLAARKIRALEFTATSLSALTTSPVQQLGAAWSDLSLIVSGRLQINRVEVDERQSRNSIKYLDRRELSHDESVIDLYVKSDAAWRIGATDFDFSCLGEQIGLTAFENLRALIELLLRRSGAELNDAYTRIRPLLNVMWPLETTSSKSRSRRPRASPKDVSVVTATDNTVQFDNYSRLAWGVKLAGVENPKVG